MGRSIFAISKIAYNLLRKYGFNKPVINVEEIASNLNIEIKSHPFSDDISGVLAIKNGKPTIGVNVSHHSYRKRFTIAHEIGHYVLKHDRNGLFVDQTKDFSGTLLFRNNDSSTGEKAQEREANAFAAALLMPQYMIQEELLNLEQKAFDLSSNDVDIIAALATTFEVSKQAMSIRFLNLRL